MDRILEKSDKNDSGSVRTALDNNDSGFVRTPLDNRLYLSKNREYFSSKLLQSCWKSDVSNELY